MRPSAGVSAGGIAAVAAPRWAPARLAGSFHPALADRAALARVLAASGADRRPSPARGSYFGDLMARLAAEVARASQELNLPRWLLLGVASFLVLAVLALVFRALHARRRAARAGGLAAALAATGPAEPEGAGPSGAAAVDGSWGAAEWRREIDRRLAEDRVAEALRATWWWLARSLAGEAAAPAWTGRELLRRTRREDLRELLCQLDGMAYGPHRPAAGDVRLLARRLEAALA